MLNTNQLDILTAAADLATSDADLAAQLSTPIKTPKPDRVTYTTLGGVWGAATAASFHASLKGAIAAGGSFGAIADYIDTLLSGPGIDPADAEVPEVSAAFVAANLATQQQVDGVFFNTTYPAGDVVTVSNVTASRARVALSTGKQSLIDWLDNQYDAAVGVCDEGQRSGTLPTKAQLQAIFDPNT